jgi:hypothetical protein
MRATCLVLALAGCNQLLGDARFETVPDAATDAAPDAGDSCAAHGLPPTTLSGTVLAPNGTLPLYGALVYVPTRQLAPIPDGVGGACASGAPLLLTHSDETGAFQLANVPSGNVPLVIQIGKWRREHVIVPDVQPCMDNPVDPVLTRLPQSAVEGSLPHVALVTGGGEALECIARDVGVDASEIGTGADFSGHVHLYVNNGVNKLGSTNQAIDPMADLFPALASYDLAMFGCHGGVTTPPTGAPQTVQVWTNAGGWLFLDHDQYVWLTSSPAPWPSFATFSSTTTQLPNATISIDTTTPIGGSYLHWLQGVGVAGSDGEMMVQQGKRECSAVDANQVTPRLMLDPALNGGNAGVQSFTWAAGNGGRVTFDDMHANLTTPSTSVAYPAECSAPVAQEIAMMFQLFETPTPLCAQ